jgi:FixH
MNWPRGIILVFLLFAGGIFFLVYKTTQKKSEMVTDNYYQQELVYQQVIDGKRNAQKLSALPKITVQPEYVEVLFPVEAQPSGVTGDLYFYRASDKQKDLTALLSLDPSRRQFIPRNEFSTGSYMVKITWQSGDQSYYSEQNLYIP